MNMTQRPIATDGRPIDPALMIVRDRFVDSLAERILRFENLKIAIETGAHDPRAVLKAIADLAHKIAGVAGTLGFEDIGQLCMTLDRRIQNGTAAQTPCSRLWAEISEPLENLLDAMEAKLDT